MIDHINTSTHGYTIRRYSFDEMPIYEQLMIAILALLAMVFFVIAVADIAGYVTHFTYPPNYPKGSTWQASALLGTLFAFISLCHCMTRYVISDNTA